MPRLFTTPLVERRLFFRMVSKPDLEAFLNSFSLDFFSPLGVCTSASGSHPAPVVASRIAFMRSFRVR